MNRALLILLLIISNTTLSVAQQKEAMWSLRLGGQVSYGFVSEPELRTDAASGFLSGYSPSYSAGALVSVGYRLLPSISLSAAIGTDMHRFSYDLVSPLTFGEVNGRTVPGRNFTEFKGLGASGFADLGVGIQLSNSAWSPTLLFRIGARQWLMEHSNADEAYAQGYQELATRDDGRNQLHYGAGFSVSPFLLNAQISLVYQQTLDPYEPLHKLLVLRQTFLFSNGRSRVTCPTF